MSIAIDPEFKALIPPLSPEELAGLRANLIAWGGAREPLVVWNGVLLDGHNRHAICTELGLPFTTCAPKEAIANRDDATLWIIRNQLGRRNLPSHVRIALAEAQHAITAERAKANQRAAGGAKDALSPDLGKAIERIDTIAAVAKAAGVSAGTVSKVRAVNAKAPAVIRDRLAAGEISIDQAHAATNQLAKLPAPEREAALLAIESGARPSEVLRETNRLARLEKLEAIAAGNTPLSSLGRTFSLLYADPPWRYESPGSDSRAIENHYPTEAHEDICALDVTSVAAENAILFMWTTPPKIAEAVRVLDAWGFDFRTSMVWDKEKMGPGYYVRQQHELLFIAIKGDMPLPDPTVTRRQRSVVRIEREGHSEKPDFFYDMIDRMYPTLTKLELFARDGNRPGWAFWGNQAHTKGAA